MQRTAKCFFALVSLMLITTQFGCDPLTRNRYDLLQIDASDKTDVELSFGKPTVRHPNQWIYQRSGKHLNVIVDFDSSGRTTRKQWIDATANEWNDSEPAGDLSTRESIRIRTVR